MNIDNKFLFNFTDTEKEDFRQQQDYKTFCQTQYKYNINNDGQVKNTTSDLEIKYITNRIALNDDNLISLSLNNIKLDEEQLTNLANAFKKNSNCLFIDLSGSDVSEKGMERLAVALSDKPIKQINLKNINPHTAIKPFIQQKLSQRNEWLLLSFDHNPLTESLLSGQLQRKGIVIVSRQKSPLSLWQKLVNKIKSI